MFTIIISILILITVVIAAIYFERKSILFALLLIPIIFFASTIKTVPTGVTGVLVTFGKVEDNTLEAGLHIISPFQQIVSMDNRVQKHERTESVFSKDIQETNVRFSINHSINKTSAMTLYKTIGTNYYDILIVPRVIENLKNVFSHYSANELVTKREILSGEINKEVEIDLSEFGIICSINIEDVDFRDEYTNAVEAKQVAEQNKLRAQTEQLQRTAEAEAENTRTKEKAVADAEAAISKATADAEVARLQADAAKYKRDQESEAKKFALMMEAEGNESLAKSLSQEVIDYMYSNRWDGKLPTTWFGNGDDTLPVVNIGTEDVKNAK